MTGLETDLFAVPDAERLVASTNSGQTALKEAYAYRMEDGEPAPDPVRRL